MSGSSGTAAAAAAANTSQNGHEEDEQQAVLTLAAAAAAAARRLPGVSPLAGARSRSPGSGGGTLSPPSEYGSDDMNEDLNGEGLAGGRNSGSLSTLDPSEMRSDGLPTALLHGFAQQLAAVHGQHQQHGLGLPAYAGHSHDAPAQRGRRNARQQEQNKQAQQRYRAKRKAQFEDLQRKVQHLTSEAAGAQRLRQENDKLRAELAKLRAIQQAPAAGGSSGAAAAAAAAAGDAPLQSNKRVAEGRLEDLPGGRQANQQQQQQQQQQQGNGSGSKNGVVSPQQQQQQQLVPGSSGPTIGGSGAFKPMAVSRPLAAATLAELPQSLPAAAGPQQHQQQQQEEQQQAVVPLPTGRQVHAALDLYYQDLQSFACSVKLEQVPSDGSGLGAEAALKLTELVRTGLELVKVVLRISGPEAASLLTAGLPSVGADGMSPADSLAQWCMVAARVGLTPEQHLLLADWRRRFLQKLDDCYGRRLLHKAQLAQLPGGGGGGGPGGQQPQMQWVEALLLQAAESVGFSACALACAQLEGVLSSLADNLKEERGTACAMMTELLDRIFTKVQAARFLLAGHPFCWNGLSFALAAASLAPPSSAAAAPAVKQEQPQPLSQLLARLQSAAG